MRYVARWGSS